MQHEQERQGASRLNDQEAFERNMTDEGNYYTSAFSMPTSGRMDHAIAIPTDEEQEADDEEDEGEDTAGNIWRDYSPDVLGDPSRSIGFGFDYSNGVPGEFQGSRLDDNRTGIITENDGFLPMTAILDPEAHDSLVFNQNLAAIYGLATKYTTPGTAAPPISTGSMADVTNHDGQAHKGSYDGYIGNIAFPSVNGETWTLDGTSSEVFSQSSYWRPGSSMTSYSEPAIPPARYQDQLIQVDNGNEPTLAAELDLFPGPGSFQYCYQVDDGNEPTLAAELNLIPDPGPPQYYQVDDGNEPTLAVAEPEPEPEPAAQMLNGTVNVVRVLAPQPPPPIRTPVTFLTINMTIFNKLDRICFPCKKACKDPKDYRRHYLSKHDPLRPYKCRVETCKYHTLGVKRRDNHRRHEALTTLTAHRP